MSRIRANQITNQSADGAPTVQNGLVISGVTTSTTFSGSGANLTNLNGSNIASGTVPVARIGTGTKNTSTFYRGDGSFATVTSTTINNNADNRIITGSGTANTLEGEATLTYNSGTMFLSNSGGDAYLKLSRNASVSDGTAIGTIDFCNNTGNTTNARVAAYASGGSNVGGHLYFETRDPSNSTLSERLRITSDGKFGIGINSPDQTVHIHKGSAGSIDSSTASVLTLENNTTAVLQFLTPNNVSAQLRFGDPQDNGAGFIDYSHSSNTMAFGVYGPTRMQLDSNGHLGLDVASVTQLSNSKQLTLRPGNDDGIRFVRPGDGNNNPNVHLDLTTTTSGSAYPSGEAYTVKYRTYNCDQIFETYEGGGTGGHIAFKTAPQGGTPTERLTINEDGQVTKPSQPSFAAYKNQGSYSLNNEVFPLDTVRHNIGSHYNTSNYRFTAPVAGRYLFTFYSILNSTINSGHYEIRINNSSGNGQSVHFTTTNSHWDHVSSSHILNLSVNDYVTMYSVSNVGWHGSGWQLFCGELLS